MTINIAGLEHTSIVNGPGVRYSIYFQGCRHHCEGCHNPSTWGHGGTIMSVSTIIDNVERDALTKDVTLTGGDPLEQPAECLALCKELKAHGFNIWLYTGYTIGEVEAISPTLLDYVDTVVDGPYVQDLPDNSPRFRGSHNQRIINVPAYLQAEAIRAQLKGQKHPHPHRGNTPPTGVRTAAEQLGDSARATGATTAEAEEWANILGRLGGTAIAATEEAEKSISVESWEVAAAYSNTVEE